jgi:DNA-directed RNA polymerase specialized sigma24 family protein
MAITAASCTRLVRKIADRDRDALVRLHRLLIREIFTHVRARLGDTAAAVPVTRAVFVEVWRLAPASRAWHEDARAWLFAIADRRVDERLRLRGRPLPLHMDYDEHISMELSAALRRGRPPREAQYHPRRWARDHRNTRRFGG